MSRVRNLVDYQSQTADLDGDATRDLNISGTVTAGAVASANVPDVNLTIAPEVLEIQVDAPDAGQDVMWKWTWLQSTLPYARRTITNSAELNVPLYKEGTYVVNNFAAYDIHGSMTQTHSLYLKWIKSAGTDNLVSWATSAGPISDTHPDINGGTATDVQRITVNVPATITPPTLTNPTVSYTVTNTASGSYTFSGAASGNNPNLGPFYRGGTYTINISATGHPFYFTTDNGTNFSAGTYFGEYTSGVTGSRTDSGTITFTVPAGAPDTLYYQCGNHGAMRGEITVKDLAVETNINGNYVVYFQHTQEGHATPVELRPIPSLVNQMCIVYDAGSGKFVPQDLATYVENTPSFENKIREVAGTAELVVEDGSAVIAKVNVYDDSTYLPLTGNNPGDQAFATDTDILYIWDGSAWQQAGAANSDDLTEGSTNLFYTDARVNTYLSAQGYDTATNIVASITDSAPGTLDTLNELAAALGDDPNFATTTANNIATKVASSDFNSLWDARFASDSTTNLSEGTNLYYTDTRVDARITKTAIDALNVDADTLDSLNSTQFLRSDTNSNLTSGYIRFYDNNIEYGRLYANGNLAIGTTTPTYEIEIRDNAGGDLVNIDRTNGRVGINGPAYFPLNVTNNVDGVISRWRRDGGTNNPLVEIELSEANNAGYIVQSGSNTGDLGFKIGSDIKMMLKNNGNVGIGTNSPDTILHISSAGSPQIRVQDTTNDVRGQFTANDSNVVIGTVSNHSLNFATNNGNQVTLAGSNLYPTNNNTSQLGLSNRVWNKIWTTDLVVNNNVGIGTSSPDLKLHVDGSNGYPATSGTTPVGYISLRAKSQSSSHGANIGVANSAPWGTWIQAQDAGNLATNYPLLLNPNGGNIDVGNSSSTVAIPGMLNAGDGVVIAPTEAQSTPTEGDGWYTIATLNGGRKQGTIELYEYGSSRHNYVKIDVVWSYGQGSISVVNAGRHSQIAFTKARLMYDTTNQTYATGLLQVYFSSIITSVSTKLSYTKRTNWLPPTLVTSLARNDAPTNYATLKELNPLCGGSGPSQWIGFGTSDVIRAQNQPSWNLRPNSSGNVTMGASNEIIGWSALTNGSSSTMCHLTNVSLSASSSGTMNANSSGRINIQYTGTYKVWCTIRCENTPGTGNIYLKVNGSIVARQHVEVWGRYNYAHGFHSHVMKLNQGDYIEWMVSRSGGVVSGYNDTVNWAGGIMIG